MLVLKEIHPQVNLVEVTGASEQIGILQKAYGVFFTTAINLLVVFDTRKNLIVRNANIVVADDLYITKLNRFSVGGCDAEEILLRLDKYGSEYFIVDQVMIELNWVELFMHPLKDSWINNISLPIIRNKIIDELLNNL